MITKINKLKNFGVFQNFIWNGLDDFKKKNLIYGWNYSGKTTISKLFQNIEFKDKDKYFSGSEFDITTKVGETITNYTQNNIDDFLFNVKVFNSEYIKRVFTWDNPNSEIDPISFYLGDTSGDLDVKLSKLTEYNLLLRDRAKCIKDKYVKSFENFNKQNGIFSAKAKEIRENYLNNTLDQNKLNKSQIKTITDSIKNDIDAKILSDADRDIAKKEATEINTFEKQVEKIRFTENLKTLIEEVKVLLEKTAPQSISLPNLDEDENLFNWVQLGLELHKSTQNCKFCTNILPESRITDLNTYYSEKLQEIQTAIEYIKSKIQTEREKFDINFLNKKDLGTNFQENYQEGINDYEKIKIKYNAKLTILESDLKRKSSNYFTNISATKIDVISFTENFNKLEKALKEHNIWLSEFDKNKKKALKKILNHYVAEFLKIENYNQKEVNKNKADILIININTLISSNETKILSLDAQLKSTVKGQKELNITLEILLHRSDIKIEIKDDKFTLERSGHTANNLSEGEKSAIAFSYFLTELKALRKDEPSKLPNTIIFIDDPISSLDSNHIFQVRSLLHSFLRENDFLQLFISTHNFEFFSVMLDTKIFGRITKNTSEAKRPLYFIKRQDDNSSLIKKLPSSFSSYKSEYVGLFHTIKDFIDLDNKEEYQYVLLLPNAVRRFLELYTLMKYPIDAEVDIRMKTVFNPEEKPLHNTKLLHWFSHLNQFEKVQQHDDKLLQIEDAINELFEHIKNEDNLHWKGLVGE